MYAHAMYVLILGYVLPCVSMHEVHMFDRVECDEKMYENFFLRLHLWI